MFLVAAGLFFVLPRVGLATLPLRARLGQMITGFSERVELGSYGSILTDSNVVMRVHLPDEVQPDRYPNLRWRGIVLDTFDGQAWSLRYPRQIRLVRPNSGGFDVGLLGGSGQFLRQEIFLEPIAIRGGLRRAARPPPDDGGLDVGDGRHGRGVRLVSGRPAPLHRGVRGRGSVGPGREPAAVGAAARRQPAPALPAAAGPGAGDPGAGPTGRGPEPDARGDRAPRGGVPADQVPLHARHRAGEQARPTPGVPLRAAGRPLRVLRGGDGGDAQDPRRSIAGRERVPAGGMESVRAVLHRPVLRCPLVGRGVHARRRLGDLRPDAPGDGGHAEQPAAHACCTSIHSGSSGTATW